VTIVAKTLPSLSGIPAVDLDSDQGFRALVELSPDAVFVIADGYHIFANARGLELLGADSLAELQRKPSIEFMHPRCRGEARSRMSTLVNQRRMLEYVEECVVRLDGSVVDIESAGTPIVVDGRPAALVVARDITARKQAEAAVRTAELRWQAAFRQARTAMLIADESGWVIAANPALGHLVQRDLATIVHAPCWSIIAEADRDAVRHEWIRLTIGSEPAIDGEFRYERADGVKGWVYANAAPLGDDKEFIVHLTDVTDSHRTRQTLARRANRDPLTGLPNRYVILDTLAGHAADVTQPVALLFLDLDGFKQINDQYGHQVGDEILTVVGQRLRSAVRQEDVVGRLGGDEFAVVLRGEDSAARAAQVAARITDELAVPVIAGGTVLQVTASIGVASSEDLPHRGGQALLADADAAMYDAKTRAQPAV